MYSRDPLSAMHVWNDTDCCIFSEEGNARGLVAAFMITGPATKITNLGALKISMGWKHFAFYIVFVMLFSCISGLIVNCF